jgi:hypothetical protein
MNPQGWEAPEGRIVSSDKEEHSVATPQEREQQRKQERQREFDRQIRTGSLVVRQMTAEERIEYAESPKAAAEREARRARKRS